MIINNEHFESVWMENKQVKMINQPALPHIFEIVSYTDYRDVAKAISTMVVRGAPAIGATGAYGLALAVIQGEDINKAAQILRATRPTAQDLFYGIDYVLNAIKSGYDATKAAREVADKYINACKKIGEFGASLIKDGYNINTHCNAGWLATPDWGTAIAPIYTAKRQSKDIFVYVDETRPRCQGSRLTAFELTEENIPHCVIADNAAGHFMRTGKIDMVIVGSDRIAMNGDIANKIGTYSSAVVAKENSIPFYVAAPLATIDQACPSGEQVPIEERSEDEVTGMFGWSTNSKELTNIKIAPKQSKAKNPAFDITPARYITGIITEKGICKPTEIKSLFN